MKQLTWTQSCLLYDLKHWPARMDIPSLAPDPKTIDVLVKRGFIEKRTQDGRTRYVLTPLGERQA